MSQPWWPQLLSQQSGSQSANSWEITTGCCFNPLSFGVLCYTAMGQQHGLFLLAVLASLKTKVTSSGFKFCTQGQVRESEFLGLTSKKMALQIRCQVRPRGLLNMDGINSLTGPLGHKSENWLGKKRMLRTRMVTPERAWMTPSTSNLPVLTSYCQQKQPSFSVQWSWLCLVTQPIQASSKAVTITGMPNTPLTHSTTSHRLQT